MPFLPSRRHVRVRGFAPSLLGTLLVLQCGSDTVSDSSPHDAGSPPVDAPHEAGDARAKGRDAGTESGPVEDAGLDPTVVRADDPRQAAVSRDLGVAVDANNAFTLDLYRELLSLGSGGNFITSPFSANLALTMTYAGAVGETKTQMATVLHIPETGPSIFDAQNALSQAVVGRGPTAATADAEEAEGDDAGDGDDTPVVQLVNEVWGQTGYTWQTPFLATLAESYGTGVYAWDFRGDPSGAESTINQWVSQETAGGIDPLLPPSAIGDDARMVLVNALHLKLPWLSSFDPGGTVSETFTRADGSTVNVPFMSNVFGGGVGYTETSTATLVSLPLIAKTMSVVFALPKSDLPTLTASLTTDSFAVPEMSGLDELILYLPKVKVTSAPFKLGAALQALGMTDAFSEAADFTGLCADPPDGAHLRILEAYQSATIDIEESGVAASAATAVVVYGDGGADDTAGSTYTVRFDKPYVVAVVDASGAILFLGQVTDPSAGG